MVGSLAEDVLILAVVLCERGDEGVDFGGRHVAAEFAVGGELLQQTSINSLALLLSDTAIIGLSEEFNRSKSRRPPSPLSIATGVLDAKHSITDVGMPSRLLVRTKQLKSCIRSDASLQYPSQ